MLEAMKLPGYEDARGVHFPMRDGDRHIRVFVRTLRCRQLVSFIWRNSGRPKSDQEDGRDERTGMWLGPHRVAGRQTIARSLELEDSARLL
jgi:hypothetical protein